MKVQIIHSRDPDSECYIEVYLNGVKLSPADVVIEDIDPGRGHTWEDNWKDRLDEAMAERDRNPHVEYLADRFQALLAGAESQYVEGKPDDWGIPYGYEPI